MGERARGPNSDEGTDTVVQYLVVSIVTIVIQYLREENTRRYTLSLYCSLGVPIELLLQGHPLGLCPLQGGRLRPCHNKK
jgi:hypothetical protein